MPDQNYTVKDNQSGKTITFQWHGDQAPTDADMEQVFSEARQSPASTAQAAPEKSWADTAADVARGVEKGAVGTFVGLGKLAHRVPGVSNAVDALYGTQGISQQAFKEADRAVTSQNTGEMVGKTLEQIAEFFIPVSRAASLGAKGTEVIKSGLIGAAQSGSPATGVATAALTSVIPGGGAAKRLAGALDEGAEKSIVQALGPTKEWAKDEAATLAPEMLRRGIKGSREAMLERAVAQTDAAGQRLGAAYQAAAQEGKTISGLVVRGELQFAKDGLMVPNAAGKLIPIEGAQPVISKLNALEEFVGQLGDDVPVDKAGAIKSAWDKIVASAGLYGKKSAQSAVENPDAWAIREAASSMRRLLGDASPDIAALNKEYGFWKALRNVLKETQERTQAQGGGLGRMIGAGTGAPIGATIAAAGGAGTGGILTSAALAGTAGRALVRVMQSPYWRTSVSAPLKAQLADALASNSAGMVASTTAKIMTALPVQLRAQFAQ